MTTDYHNPVLLYSAVEFLINPRIKEHVIFDGTLGGGGYSELICEKISADSKLISVDKDENALEFSKIRLKNREKKIIITHGNFADLKTIVGGFGFTSITGVVLDLGLSSYQLNFEDGFSYMRDTDLDMRADKNSSLKASDVINGYSEKELTEVFLNYGEIHRAERLSRAICISRNRMKINSTMNFIGIIKNEYGFKFGVPVKFLSKIFQALRIEVNNELGDLAKVLEDAFSLLVVGGRIVVVSYHSLEDRIVKNFLRKYYYKAVNSGKALNILTKKVIKPDYAEIRQNSRARSAKLRAGEVMII
ncbi:MAG: 16S rRNA (cytosine(1402)-N(4))-methyltransferase RsmH [Ignavibacteria bacterium]|nr:16S rRNA (cytosine(1402)-N(4))-methyltransferase RsmH [Ignavibacteria bacterium]